MITISTDFKDAYAALEHFERKMQITLLAKAIRTAFKPVLEDARRRAPKLTGLLRKRIKMSVVKPRGGEQKLVVGLRLGEVPASLKGSSKPEARNWSWYEMGIPARGIPAHPFFRPALDANAERVLSLLKQELEKQILEAVRRA